jgi:hypothetical protein
MGASLLQDFPESLFRIRIDVLGRKICGFLGTHLCRYASSYIVVTAADAIVIRIIHGWVTQYTGPVANAVVANIAGNEKGKYL